MKCINADWHVSFGRRMPRFKETISGSLRTCAVLGMILVAAEVLKRF